MKGLTLNLSFILSPFLPPLNSYRPEHGKEKIGDTAMHLFFLAKKMLR
jgi:hypothetical protein